jgi:hypothetical protein
MVEGIPLTRLHTFFQGADDYLGIFYPAGYLLAMFSDLDAAQLAAQELRHSGRFQPDEVAAASGVEVILHNQEHSHRPLGFLMTNLSRMIGTEAFWAERDVQMARQGCALLAVHCPFEELKNAAWQLVECYKPLAARYYSAGLGGIEHLAGDLEEG